jgi:hypothetical protein
MAWQALTCLAIAPLGGAKEERLTPKAFASGRSIRKALFPTGNFLH